jgi:hypothetical protein
MIVGRRVAWSPRRLRIIHNSRPLYSLALSANLVSDLAAFGSSTLLAAMGLQQVVCAALALALPAPVFAFHNSSFPEDIGLLRSQPALSNTRPEGCPPW